MPEFVGKKFNSSSEMCEDILKKTGVALLPGSDFGFNKERMLARLSFTDFDGEQFMKKTQNENIDISTIEKLAPKVVDGVNNLKTGLNKFISSLDNISTFMLVFYFKNN